MAKYSKQYSGNERGAWDEFGCFNINDFKKGDNVEITDRRTKVRTKGIVVSTVGRPASIVYSDINGDTHTARLNDVSFLQAPQQGWLER